MFKKKKKDTVDEQQDSQSRKSGIKIGKVAGGVIAFFLAGYLLVGSIYSLKENEYAVITTFGVPGVVEESGIHVKLPYIQRLAKVPKTINGFPIGYESETGNFVDKESFMITRDYNFVNVDFYVEYRVTDPVKYLFASEDPISILKNLTQSYIRDTIGLYDVDSVITTGKNEIQASIKEKIITRLDEEDIGIQLVNITIQDAEPPTQEVINAFKNVENAKQGKETSINRANQKRNEDIPAARAAADETVKTAQAQAEERINEAKGQTARLNELYAEYQKYPLITKQRMFYEAMEEILPTMKVIIEKSDGTTQTMLPLESFADFTAAGNGGNADGSSANDTVNTVKSDTAGGTESAESE
ncbi:MAG: FtsH protease activity modulator HflK [Lachnospiraceae bacterium]|jgi:membrane protease subunit HflK|nr:FtsH protease activity modulator HflK [Lachnospiraceae bacterium]